MEVQVRIRNTISFIESSDTALYQLLPVLNKLSKVDDVRVFIPRIVSQHKVNFKKAYKILKIDEDYHNEYDDNDSWKELATSEFEGDIK